MAKIIPIRELKNTSNVSELCHNSDEPIYITKNGYGDMVLMSMDLYNSMQKRWSMYTDIVTSEEQIKTGHIKDARKALASVRGKYGL
ncbi:MAG: type II toxin-antitoxin system Phd/YefM family antitoxin [Lachnospiraceae bacterium]|nr:type II toxin-antitoxin system Phd/YefM family antitoxin [Lachnospiraceae bacterium]MBR6474404.1 type II toxin-antitoxin system Phd/YefM family antitoxin [Lachnospiraceae bacterium]